MTYSVRAHDGHYHVLDEYPDLLDDRPINPWIYASRRLANDVAALLNHGYNHRLVRDLEADQIHVRAYMLSPGVVAYLSYDLDGA